MVNCSTNDAARSGAEAVGSHALVLARTPLMQSGNLKALAVRTLASKGRADGVSDFIVHEAQASS